MSDMVHVNPNQPAPEHHGNDLEEFVAGAKRLFSRYGKWMLYGLLVVLAGMVIGRWLVSHREDARQEAYAALAAASSPLAIAEVAREYDTVPGLAGIAYLRAADMYLNQAVMGEGTNDLAALLGGTPTAQKPEEERRDDLLKAADLYSQVIALNESELQVLNARLGLAAARESLGEFEAAREQYERVIADAGEKWGLIGRRAGARLASLESVVEAVEFTERAEPNLGGAVPGLFDPLTLPGLPSDGSLPPVLGDEGAAPEPGEGAGETAAPSGAEGATPVTPESPATPEGETNN